MSEAKQDAVAVLPEVYCVNHCDWVGLFEDLKTDEHNDYCPKCGASSAMLLDIDITDEVERAVLRYLKTQATTTAPDEVQPAQISAEAIRIAELEMLAAWVRKGNYDIDDAANEIERVIESRIRLLRAEWAQQPAPAAPRRREFNSLIGGPTDEQFPMEDDAPAADAEVSLEARKVAAFDWLERLLKSAKNYWPLVGIVTIPDQVQIGAYNKHHGNEPGLVLGGTLLEATEEAAMRADSEASR